MTPHIPLLRQGVSYESLDTQVLSDPRDGTVLARISQANTGLIQRDLGRIGAARRALEALSHEQLVAISERAGALFMEGELPLGSTTQTPEQYVKALSASSGLPYTLCRNNMGKIHKALHGMRGVLRGLTRGLDLSVLDRGFGVQDEVAVSYVPTTNALAAILPSNSPGVNSIWLPALALRTPVVIKPGREEPWTPYRLIQALIAAGCPAAAFSFYPTSHEGADLMLRHCGRGIIFGDDKTTGRYADNPGIECHGTGRSKVLIGEDRIDDWPELLDLLVDSVVKNGGRSCINASAIVVPRHGDAIAEALAQRLVQYEPRPADAEDAILSAFANARFAELIDALIERGLSEPGASEITARYREGPRRVCFEGAQYLCPTVVRCDNLEHGLANTEFLFPYTSVVELPQQRMVAEIGPSLVVSAITEDSAFMNELLRAPGVDRLNLGAMPTTHVEWDQPHEGNLFDLLYRRRAIQTIGLS